MCDVVCTADKKLQHEDQNNEKSEESVVFCDCKTIHTQKLSLQEKSVLNAE